MVYIADIIVVVVFNMTKVVVLVFWLVVVDIKFLCLAKLLIVNFDIMVLFELFVFAVVIIGKIGEDVIDGLVSIQFVYSLGAQFFVDIFDGFIEISCFGWLDPIYYQIVAIIIHLCYNNDWFLRFNYLFFILQFFGLYRLTFFIMQFYLNHQYFCRLVAFVK